MKLSSQLQGILNDLPSLAPELIIVLGSVLFLIASLFRPSNQVLKIAVGFVLLSALNITTNQSGMSYDGFIVNDDVSKTLKLIFIGSGILILAFKRTKHVPEFYFLMLGLIVGSMMITSTLNLLLIYLSIELTSFSSYLLSGIGFGKKKSEAAIKYLLFGGTSSAVMLYGISLLYGANGGLMLSDIVLSDMTKMGLVLFVGGLLFKTSIAPFHFWVPSTYQGAPTDSVAILSVIPKLAAFGLIYHLNQELSQSLASFLNPILVCVATVTVLWGTLGAISQRSIKRLVAYGAIAHSGYILLLILPQMEEKVFLLYAIIYAVMSIGMFYGVDSLEQGLGEDPTLESISGLGMKNPFFGVGVVVIVVSLIGLPPTAGFTAKLGLFSTIWVLYSDTSDVLLLAYFIIGILSTVVALFYYLRIPYFMFFQKKPNDFRIPNVNVGITVIFALLLLIMFFQANILETTLP